MKTAEAPRQFRSNKPGFGTPVRRKYFLMWKKACEAHGWKSSDDSKRHAFHLSTFGKNISSKDFEVNHWDRVFVALKVLIDDLDLAAQIEQIAMDEYGAAKATHKATVKPGKRNPGRTRASQYEEMPEADHPGERRRLEYFISRLFMPSYIRAISVNRFDEADWMRLSLRDMTDLRDLLRNRLSKWLTTAKLTPDAHRLPQGIPISPRSRSGIPTNEQYIQALLDRGSPVDMRDQVAHASNMVEPDGEDPF